jgi:hypothetical protein
MKYILLLPLTALLISCGQPAVKKPATDTDSSQLSPSIAGPDANSTLNGKATSDTVPVVRRTELVIQDVQAQTLDSTTVIGKPGDLLLTFTGKGFIFTESNPSVKAGGIAYDQTYSNEEGTELYAIIPAQERKRFSSLMRGELRVINPDTQSAGIKKEAVELLRKADGGERVALVYTKYGVARKPVKR